MPSGKYPISSLLVIAKERIPTISEARGPCRRIVDQLHPAADRYLGQLDAADGLFEHVSRNIGSAHHKHHVIAAAHAGLR